MKLVLEQNEIEAALEAFVRSQISVPQNQIITVRPHLNDQGVLEASVFLNATSAPIAPNIIPVHHEDTEPPKPIPMKRSRGAKAEAVPQAAEQVNTGANITTNPEDRHPPEDAPAKETVDQPTPQPASKNSIFAGLRAVKSGPEEVTDPPLNTEDLGGAPVEAEEAAPSMPEPKRSLFSFNKS